MRNSFINNISADSKKALLKAIDAKSMEQIHIQARNETLAKLPCFQVPKEEFNKELHKMRLKYPHKSYKQLKYLTRKYINKQYEKKVISKSIRRVNLGQFPLNQYSSKGNTNTIYWLDELFDSLLVSIGH